MKKIFFLFLFIITVSQIFAQKMPAPSDLFPYFDNGKWGYLQKDGEIFINPRFEYADYFHEGYAVIKQDGKYGFIDAQGRETIHPSFMMAHAFREGYAIVEDTFFDGMKQYAFINYKGETVPNQLGTLVSASDFHNSRAIVMQIGNPDLLIIDKNFKVAFTNSNCILFDDSTQTFHEGLLKSMCNNRIGFLDTMGRVFLNPMVDDAGIFSENLAVFYQTELAGYMNKDGQPVINPKWDIGYPFSEGMARVVIQTTLDPATYNKVGGISGFIDKIGNEVVLPQFEDAGDFHSGMAWVKVNGKYGFIDKTGKQIIPSTYDAVKDFYNGLAWVKSGNSYMYIDTKGKIVWHSSN